MIDTNGPVNDASDVVYLATTYGGRAVDINNNMIVGTTGSNSSTGEYAKVSVLKFDPGSGSSHSCCCLILLLRTIAIAGEKLIA